MENEQHEDQSEGKRGVELPLHFRLMDVYLEQVEKAIPLLTTMVKDMQTVYISGTRMTIKAAEMIEERVNTNPLIFRGISKTVEAVAPLITEAQTAVTRTLSESAIRSIRIMRKEIRGLQ